MSPEEISRIKSLIGRTVRVNRGGPESRLGRLLAVQPDHLVLMHDEEGVIYHNLEHIKSITADSTETPDLEKQSAEAIPTFYNVNSFDDVLNMMKHQWVQINRGGPESLKGVLSDNFYNHILLIIKSELVRIYKSHIHNVSYVLENAKKQQSDAEQSSNENAAEAVENDAATSDESAPAMRKVRTIKRSTIKRSMKKSCTEKRRTMTCRKKILIAKKKKNKIKRNMRAKKQFRVVNTCPCRHAGAKTISKKRVRKVIISRKRTFGINSVSTLWFSPRANVWKAV